MRTVRDEDDDSSVSFEDVTVVGKTAKAMLCNIDGEEHWVPRSQVHDDSEVFVNDKEEIEGSPGKLVVQRWWAQKNGLA